MKRTRCLFVLTATAAVLLSACGGTESSGQIIRTVRLGKTSSDCPAEAKLDETFDIELTVTRVGDEDFAVSARRIDGEPQGTDLETTVEPLGRDESVDFVDAVRDEETVALGSGFFGCFTCSHFGGTLTAKEGSTLDTDQGLESAVFILDYYRGAVLGSCTTRWVQQGN